MNKICTSIEQSKKLLELGVDVNTADMFYNEEQDETYPKDIVDTKYPMVIREGQKHYLEEYGIHAWSLSALLGLMPNFTLNGFGNGQFNCRDERADCYALVDTCPLDAAFQLICWLKVNGKI